MLEPKIVIVMPEYCENKILGDVSSPIKNLEKLRDAERISEECRKLLDDNECWFESNKKDDSMEKRLSVGEKIKGKLESTNNRSPTIPNSKCSTSEFLCDSISESKLISEEFKDFGEEQDDNPILVRTKGVFDLHQYDESVITFGQNRKDLVCEEFKEEVNECGFNSGNSFPFNQLSAKTCSNSPDLSEIKKRDSSNYHNKSPIQCLRDITNSSFSNFDHKKLEKLNFDEKEIFSKIEISEAKAFEGENGNQQEFYVGNEKEEIKGVDSVCIPREHFESYEYAMLQLLKLRENVELLENATKAFEKLKPKDSEINFPSRIEYKESHDKTDEQFLEFFEQNLRSVLCKADCENVINTHSIEKENFDEEENESNVLVKKKKNLQIKRLQFS